MIVRLNNDLDNKLSLLQAVEKTTKAEIIKRAIEEYYDHHIQEKTAYELGEKLFGCAGSETDLSKNYKKKLKDKLNEKQLNDVNPYIYSSHSPSIIAKEGSTSVK